MLFFLVGAVIVVIIGLILYARWNYGVLEKMGLPVDKPHFIFGNTYYTYATPAGLLDIDNFKRLGPIFGVYEGRQPQVHICEPELIKLITTKDSDFFNTKRIVDFRDPFFNEMVDFQPYDKWKVLRHNMSSQLSPAKVKLMCESMIQSLDTFSHRLKEAVESSPDKKLVKCDLRNEIFSTFVESMVRCCFSLKIDNPTDPDNKFLNLVKQLLEPVNELSPLVEVFCSSFPFMSRFLPSIFDPKRSETIVELCSHMMETRRKSGESKNDMIDFCAGLMDKLDTPEFQQKGINKYTVISLGFMFVFAGQDQISSITATMVYYLLQNPAVEQRIYQEVDNVMDKHGGKISHEIIPHFPYLAASIAEAVRLVPFFSRTERVCTKDWKNADFNLDIKKGMVIQIPIWAANRNPKYFPDPEKFNPDRFLPENSKQLHPYAMTSFGFGPRNCIGQRFANDILLLVSVFLFKNFKFGLREDSKPVYLGVNPGFTPHLPFYFDVEVRN